MCVSEYGQKETDKTLTMAINKYSSGLKRKDRRQSLSANQSQRQPVCAQFRTGSTLSLGRVHRFDLCMNTARLFAMVRISFRHEEMFKLLSRWPIFRSLIVAVKAYFSNSNDFVQLVFVPKQKRQKLRIRYTPVALLHEILKRVAEEFALVLWIPSLCFLFHLLGRVCTVKSVSPIHCVTCCVPASSSPRSVGFACAHWMLCCSKTSRWPKNPRDLVFGGLRCHFLFSFCSPERSKFLKR